MFGQGPVCLLRVILCIHLGHFFVNCPSLWLTCSTRHFGHSSLITVDQACAPSAKTVAFGVSFWQIILFLNCLNSSFDSGGGLGPADINFSGASAKTMLERLASYWTKMLQHIRNVSQVTGRRCYNVSGTSCKLLGEDVTTHQERLASYWTKILQRIRKSILTTQTTGRCYTPLKTPPPNPPQKKTMYKSDNSPAPRGAPSPKTCAFDFEKRDSTAEK